MFTNSDELYELLKDFYLLTGMKISIHDEDGREMCSYPDQYCPFCKRLRSDGSLDKLCRECDKRAIEECRRTKQAKIYACHAGLSECFAPVLMGDAIHGFIAIGQIRERKEYSHVSDDERLKEDYEKMPLVARDKIEAAMHILKACASYDKLKNYVRDTTQSFAVKLQAFVDGRLREDLGVERLMRVCRMSRVELYQSCKLALACTPAEFVKERRLKEAERLLKETRLTVSSIAIKCGIGNYNYFSKIFKKRYGISPREYRKT